MSQDFNGFIVNIEKSTLQNNAFRRVIYTSPNLIQLVLMSILPGQDIGLEQHPVDQFIRVEQGYGLAQLDGYQQKIGPGWALVIPANVWHNVINTGSEELKLYTIYAPPHHVFDELEYQK